MKLNCIIVDDEPLALSLLQNYVERTSYLKLIGTYDNAIDAQIALQSSKIDILFTDIQMPDMDGIQLAGCLPDATRVIFTTAFEQFALDAYKTYALDYLLKPYTYPEFLCAAERAYKWHEMHKAHLLSKNDIDALFVKSDYKYVRIAFNDILYIEGLKDYVKIHRESASRPLLTLISMQSLMEQLPHNHFLRIHRSFIVNMRKIEAVDKSSIFIQGKELPISDSHKEKVADYIKNINR